MWRLCHVTCVSCDLCFWTRLSFWASDDVYFLPVGSAEKRSGLIQIGLLVLLLPKPMDNLQHLDPRKQELFEARFLGQNKGPGTPTGKVCQMTFLVLLPFQSIISLPIYMYILLNALLTTKWKTGSGLCKFYLYDMMRMKFLCILYVDFFSHNLLFMSPRF